MQQRVMNTAAYDSSSNYAPVALAQAAAADARDCSSAAVKVAHTKCAPSVNNNNNNNSNDDSNTDGQLAGGTVAPAPDTDDDGKRSKIANLIGAIERRQHQQQHRQLTTFKGAAKPSANHNSDRRSSPIAPPASISSQVCPIERNSLESIHSKYSTSSGANDNTAAASPSTPIEVDVELDLSRADDRLGGCRTPSPNFALIGTRIVSPPQVDEASWRKLTGRGVAAHEHEQKPAGEQFSVEIRGQSARKASTTSAGANNSNSNNNDEPTGNNKKGDRTNQHDESSDNRSRKTSKSSAGSKRRRESNKSGGNAKQQEINLSAAAYKQGGLYDDDDDDSITSQSEAATTVGSGGPRANRKGPFPFAGICASLLGSLFFSTSVLFVKMLPDDTSSLAEKNKALFMRGACLVVLCGITIMIQKSTFIIKRDEILVNVLRAIFGFIGIFGSYVSLKYISLGDSTALVFSSPVWTSILSHFILKEPFRVIILLALPASMFGILMIAHPALIFNMDHPAEYYEKQPLLPLEPNTTALDGYLAEALNATLAPLVGGPGADNLTLGHHEPINADLDSATMSSEANDFEHRWPGVVIALLTSLAVSCVYIVLKFRKSTPIQTTTFWLGVMTVSITSLLMVFLGPGRTPQPIEWVLLVANGVCSWLGQALVQWALMHEDASILSVIRTSDVAVTFTLSALFLDEDILWTSVVGATIIGLVVISIVLNNWFQSLLQRAISRRNRPGSEHEAPAMPSKEKQAMDMSSNLTPVRSAAA